MSGGGAESLGRYVAEHQLGLVRYATLLAGSPALAEDLVQDLLIRLYPRWSDLAEPHPYVRRCVTNEFLSWRRRWSTSFIQVVPLEYLTQHSADPPDDGPDPDLCYCGIRRSSCTSR